MSKEKLNCKNAIKTATQIYKIQKIAKENLKKA